MNIKLPYISKETRDHVNEVINSVKLIEFSLIGKLTEYFEVTNWNEVIANFLLIKAITE